MKCRERDSNPHNHYWSRDFKSLVSTNSTIAAQEKRMQWYAYFPKLPNFLSII